MLLSRVTETDCRRTMSFNSWITVIHSAAVTHRAETEVQPAVERDRPRHVLFSKRAGFVC